MRSGYVQYKVEVKWDAETEQLEARVPSLGVGVNGPDKSTVLVWARETAEFHVEGLLEAGFPLPDSDVGDGLYVRVDVPPPACDNDNLVRMVSPDGMPVTIPCYTELLSRGLIEGLIQLAGLTEEEWDSLA